MISALKSDSAGGGQRVGRLQRFTAAAQAGIAVPFLVICGVYSIQARVTTFADVGFDPKGLYAARLDPARDRQDRRGAAAVHPDGRGEPGQVPGVASVSVGDGVPLDFISETPVSRARATATSSPLTRRASARTTWTRSVRACSPDGRSAPTIARDRSASCCCRRRWRGSSSRPAIHFAKATAGRRSASVTLRRRWRAQAYTVVGMTADLVSTQMGNPRPQLFLPLAQQPASTVLLIARGAPSDPSIRGAFHNAIAGGLRLLPGAVNGRAIPIPCSAS